jgi:transcriptional regulator with XRE-family HTH domain
MAERLEKWFLTYIGLQVREYRLERGWTTHDMANECGYSFDYIVGVENARRPPTLSFLFALSKCLDVDIASFFPAPPEQNT